MERRWLYGGLVTISVVFPLGCTTASQPQPSSAEPTVPVVASDGAAATPSTPEAEPLAVATAEPPPKFSPAEGEAAYFIVNPRTLARLDDRGFEAIPTVEGLWGLQLEADGTLYVKGFDTVYLLDDGVLRPLTAPLDQGIQALYVASKEDIWAGQMAGLFHWDGSQWSREAVEPVDALQENFHVEGQPTSIAVDRDQRVWVSTYRDLMVREGDVWRTVPRRSLSGRPERLWLDSDGAAHLELTSHVSVELPIGPRGGRRFTPKNIAWMEGGGRRPWTVVWVQSNGRRKKYRVGRDIEGVTPQPPVVDARERLWVSTAAGVTILAKDGTSTVWPMGTVPELAGRIFRFAVNRGGPAELPAVGPVHTGGARGRLIGELGPVDGATVEMCTHALGITIPPCARSRPRYTTTSDADGRFEIVDLPMGMYDVTVKQGESWRILVREERFVVAEGQPTDFGELDANRGMQARKER